ncbi:MULTISPECIES: 50S ribosomal protein L23 [Spiroplasma]|uniref:Large ribosomal subunit protein uL23 n=1 Tax=Spiroplasma ixodetis TaxID=2141 RepID=A0ABM8BYU1_9MOLU|nr:MULTISPECIES: 50S ribosomal protein L23 [Spiroplasma]TLF27331.1 MAG: 50S ribosomal protein L23 [Spiroplasma sp. WSS]WDA53684.1 MAG: 50S ribosomal protein L23 [Spiroplasma endosymbiont of Drosophila atripex]BDT04890.1 50S ribosomal protein L23 [Spiroplasma ixodetis]
MHLSEVIVKPVLTEKTYKQMAEGIYTFTVNRKANKSHVKKAFEQIFEVKVADVNIINSKPKTKTVGRFVGKTSAVKKALIKLAPGEQLSLFSSEEQS